MGISDSAITTRIRHSTAEVAAALRECGEAAATHQHPEVWSPLEYGAHVRDVLLTIRDRLVIGLVEDNSGFKPMYREERVTLGLYKADTTDEIVNELNSAAAILCRIFDAIDADALDRPVRYGFPDPQPRDLRWMGLQAIHEVEHHLSDIRSATPAV